MISLEAITFNKAFCQVYNIWQLIYTIWWLVNYKYKCTLNSWTIFADGFDGRWEDQELHSEQSTKHIVFSKLRENIIYMRVIQ